MANAELVADARLARMLLAANLGPVLVSWNADGVTLSDAATDEQRALAADIWTHRADPTYPAVARDMVTQQIAAIEEGSPITPRAQREFMLAVATLLNVPLGATSGLAKAKAVNDQIVALRAQLPPA